MRHRSRSPSVLALAMAVAPAAGAAQPNRRTSSGRGMRSALAIGLVWLAAAASAQVGPAGTLREATERAVLTLPEVAANQAVREQVAAQRRAARGLFVGPPVVSGDIEIGGEGLSEQEASVSAGLRWPGEGRAGRRAADRAGELAAATLDEARLQFAGEVRTAWWALAAAEAALGVEAEQVRIADHERDAVARLVTAGVQARRDLLLAEAERAAVRGRLSAAEAEAVTARAAYEALAGPAPARFPAEAPASLSNVEEHPGVRAAAMRAAAAEARADLLRFAARGRLEGRVGVRRERRDARDGFENALLVGVGVPIGRDHSASAESAAARSEAIRASADATRIRARILAERNAGSARLAVSRRTVEEAQVRRDALAQALALTERGRREGEIGFVEVLRARQALGAADRDLAAARVAAAAAVSNYNQALGVLP
jgi:outer membrane protein, heavy metal efflux system